MTLTQDYAHTARRAESVFTDSLEAWKHGLDAFTAPVQALPRTAMFPGFDAAEAVELQFTFIKRVLDVNYHYARQLAEATDTVAGAVLEHIEGLSTAVVEQVQGVAEATQNAVDTLEESVRETSDEIERLQHEARHRVDNAARERYRSLTKSELVDEAAKRNLPRTGTVDELIERLVQDVTSN
jgi:tRNA uridine 5-carbamoylmethylation protein Kti12